KADNKFIENIPKDTILNLIYDTEWRLKFLGLKLFSKLLMHSVVIFSFLNIKFILFNEFVKSSLMFSNNFLTRFIKL
ncbi:unnamed protein product, partial [marine sediment metagenome]